VSKRAARKIGVKGFNVKKLKAGGISKKSSRSQSETSLQLWKHRGQQANKPAMGQY
jgi:hypothetical protein